MAALGKQHRRRLVFPSPVAAHITVGEVPVSDILVVLDELNIAEYALLNKRVNVSVIIGIAQYVTHEDFEPLLSRQPFYLEALLDIGRYGLLEQQMIA